MVAMLTERDPFLRGEKSEMANEDDDENQENLKEQKQERKGIHMLEHTNKIIFKKYL